jgi:hypothetical protein
MIIGNGDIAGALQEVDRDDLLFFASGVSNSSETRASEFQREKSLLFRIQEIKHIVYFSSLAVFYSDTPYAQHKRQMEQCVKTWAFTRGQHPWGTYTIIRVGNITWGRNPHTLINHLRLQRERGEELEVQDVYRYVIDKDEFLHWMQLIPAWSCEMNLSGKRMKVAEIVNKYVGLLQVRREVVA